MSITPERRRWLARWSNVFLAVCVSVALALALWALYRTTVDNSRLLSLEHARTAQALRDLQAEKASRDALAAQQKRIDDILDGKISLNKAQIDASGLTIQQLAQQLADVRAWEASVVLQRGVAGPKGATGAVGPVGPPGPPGVPGRSCTTKNCK